MHNILQANAFRSRQIRWSSVFLLVGGWALLSPSSTAARAEDALSRIDLEIAFEAIVPVGAQQGWVEVLKKLGVADLRLRSARDGDEPSITKRASGKSYKVLGIAYTADRLTLPKKSFARNDIAGMRAYLVKLADEGTEGVTGTRGVFTLTKSQFDRIQSDLAKPITFETKDRKLAELLKDAEKSFKEPIELDALAKERVENATVAEDLKGYTAGTALAIALRNHRLALRPTMDQRTLKHSIIAFDYDKMTQEKSDAPTVWPIGYPCELTVRKSVPAMMESLNAEIAGYKLDQALGAIQPRLEVPFFYDQTAMTTHKIVPSEAVVNYPAKRTIYKSMVDSILFQAKLRGEIRVDEQGKVFYWISTLPNLHRKAAQGPRRSFQSKP